jgi:hypothetical protein
MSSKPEMKPIQLSPKNLTDRQQDAIDRLYSRDYTLLMCDMGFGKTAVSLTAASELIRDGVLSSVLVVAPARVRDLTWASEHLKWSHLAHLDVQIFPAIGQITIVSFNQLKDALTARGWDGLIVDEVTKVKTAGGVWFKSLRKHLKNFKWRVAMTGTLVDEGLENLYTMSMVCDLGAALGRNKELFLRRYFYPTDYKQYNWEPKENTSRELACLIAAFKHDCPVDDQSKPNLRPVTDVVQLDSKSRIAYNDMKRDLVLSAGGDAKIIAANSAVMSGKLQQICSGVVYDEYKDEFCLHDIKLRGVVAAINESPNPVMVVYQFKSELRALLSAFPNAGVMGDGVSRKKAMATEQQWNAGGLDVLLVHPLSAGHGLNLQFGGSYIIFYGPIWSRDQTEQVIARLWRRGQKAAEVVVRTFVMQDTVEDLVIIPRAEGKKETAAVFAAHLTDY